MTSLSQLHTLCKFVWFWRNRSSTIDSILLPTCGHAQFRSNCWILRFCHKQCITHCCAAGVLLWVAVQMDSQSLEVAWQLMLKPLTFPTVGTHTVFCGCVVCVTQVALHLPRWTQNCGHNGRHKTRYGWCVLPQNRCACLWRAPTAFHPVGTGHVSSREGKAVSVTSQFSHNLPVSLSTA